MKAENTLEIINLNIENVLRETETVPNSLKWIISEGGIPADSAYSITRKVLENNPDIYGSAIAFEPNYFKEKGYYFSPYSYRDGNSIKSKQLGNRNYDYFTWDWYITPKTLGRPCWSKPYYDDGGGQEIMCTYSVPLYDKKGKFIGIFTADIVLEWLTDMITRMKHSDKSYAFMIDKEGTYIVHHKKERILAQTIYESDNKINPEDINKLGREMTSGKKGFKIMENNGVESHIYYAPVSSTQWSLAIVTPKEEIFGGLNHINTIVVLILLIGLIFLFLITWNTVRHMTLPIIKFASSARQIAAGNFDIQLPEIDSKDELKELSNSFGYMQTELKSYIENLQNTTSVKEKIESELRIARDIQMGMIPKIFPPFPSRHEIDMYAVLNPAKEVGGDLYDYFMDGDDLYITIGDVSGKGVPASLFMAVVRSLFRAVSTNKKSPQEIVSALNASVAESNESVMFTTLFVAIFNLKTGKLDYCNAGHTPPILVSKSGECTFLDVIPNLPIGLSDIFEYKDQSILLEDGSSIVLYTDGVTEAENENQIFYGNERFIKKICSEYNKSAKSILKGIIRDIGLHVKQNEPSDDTTLVVLKYDKDGIKIIDPEEEQEEGVLVIKNEIEELDKVNAYIEQLGEELELSPTLIMNLCLAMEEAISNIIFYGYKDMVDQKIKISSKVENKFLVLKISDSGVAFDITMPKDPDITLPVEERSIGGLGIFLIKQIMTEVEYERIDDKNILTLKRIIINK